jgi:hypothetical protein
LKFTYFQVCPRRNIKECINFEATPTSRTWTDKEKEKEKTSLTHFHIRLSGRSVFTLNMDDTAPYAPYGYDRLGNVRSHGGVTSDIRLRRRTVLIKMVFVVCASGVVGSLAGSLISVRIDSGNRQYEWALHHNEIISEVKSQPPANIDQFGAPVHEHTCFIPLSKTVLASFTMKTGIPSSNVKTLTIFRHGKKTGIDIMRYGEICSLMVHFQKCAAVMTPVKSFCKIGNKLYFSVNDTKLVANHVPSMITC